ncbi:hypothetical protein EZV62_022437 [Acer yangbiense]|uniref:Pectinesterase inhibitor domain-containing protein n=1 Tax=Acer yangbiense TaxID=1000413 RepID=A0A5C7H8C7_9ROSI|nr:hypothetical protein EZV62_022437 [Acer yangbiense]
MDFFMQNSWPSSPPMSMSSEDKIRKLLQDAIDSQPEIAQNFNKDMSPSWPDQSIETTFEGNLNNSYNQDWRTHQDFSMSYDETNGFEKTTSSCQPMFKSFEKEKKEWLKCKDTRHPPSCVYALEQDPNAISALDFKALAKIALRLAVSNSTNSKNFIQDMAQKSTELTLKKALEACVSNDGYVHVVGSFESSLLGIDVDPMTANYDAMVAGDGAQWCAKALASGGLKVASVSTRNDYVMLYRKSELPYLTRGSG